MDLVEVLSFLFMLSTMELGRASSRRFSPTRLATTLTSSLPPLPTATKTGGTKDQGFIVLETNYRLYAYTDNPLQTAVLNLFVSIKWRFPNLVVGAITRESVRKALVNGIMADQVRPSILSCPSSLCNGVSLLLGPITWPRPEGDTNNCSAIRLLATSLPPCPIEAAAPRDRTRPDSPLGAGAQPHQDAGR